MCLRLLCFAPRSRCNSVHFRAQVHYGAVLVNCHHTVFDVVKEVMAGVTYQEAYRTAGLDASKRVSQYLTNVISKL